MSGRRAGLRIRVPVFPEPRGGLDVRGRAAANYRPGLEPLERKRLPSVGGPIAGPEAGPRSLVSEAAVQPRFGYLVYRITNPNRFNNHLTPPFTHVLVQAAQPVPGQIYNVLYLAMRNGTAQTFDASSGFTVRFPGQSSPIPILTGNEQWKPGQEFIFYVLTKKYYPIRNQVTQGFVFDLGGAISVAIPGPSGIFLRVTYDPATFDQTLDWIVRFSPGVPGGPAGIKFGLPNTAIYEFVSAKTQRRDFGGYF
jgi:hypothetical protein